MPTYRWRCTATTNQIMAHEWDAWQSIKDDSVPVCPTCGATAVKVLTPPNISVWATPNKGGQAKYDMDREARFDKDGPAYRRLRHDGMQPKSIERCARIEQGAETKLEVEMGKRIPKERRTEVLEVHQELQERRPGIPGQVGDVVRGKRKEVVV